MSNFKTSDRPVQWSKEALSIRHDIQLSLASQKQVLDFVDFLLRKQELLRSQSITETMDSSDEVAVPDHLEQEFAGWELGSFWRIYQKTPGKYHIGSL
ncbi:MAG: hypothetical protein ACFBSC_18055 [Microcoleaceae cyanobacterium]